MPTDSEDRVPTEEDRKWMELLRLVVEEGRRWSFALRELANQLRKESLEQWESERVAKSTVQDANDKRFALMEKRLKGLEDKFEWLQDEMMEHGSRG